MQQVAVVMLPPLTTAKKPDAFATVGKLAAALLSGGVAAIPPIQEYMAVNIKEVQYQICDRLQLGHIPLKVCPFAFSCHSLVKLLSM
jgi:hypothetical protein